MHDIHLRFQSSFLAEDYCPLLSLSDTYLLLAEQSRAIQEKFEDLNTMYPGAFHYSSHPCGVFLMSSGRLVCDEQ